MLSDVAVRQAKAADKSYALADFNAVLPISVQRLSAVGVSPRVSEIQRERLDLLEMFEAPHNLPVADYARLVGKSRRAVSYDIQAGKLLALHLGNLGQRVPDWQLDPLKRQFSGVDARTGG